MTLPGNHIAEELLSAHADNQLTADESAHVQAHLASCTECQERFEAVRSVATLLRRLPEVELPRDFSLGPRLVADVPNVIRLQRWYTATRTAAASLAAVFVLLSAGTLYIDSRPGAAVSTEASKPQVLSAPAAPTAQPGVAARAAAPAAVPVSSPAAANAPAAGAAAARPAAAPQADDQVAAATSVQPLPTPVPTPSPTAAPRGAAAAPAAALPAPDPAAPVRAGAVAVGVLAVLALLATLVVRHRLRRQLFHL